MALTQVQGIFLHIFVGTVKSLFKGIFLHILVGTVKSLLQNDTTLKNLRKYTSFQWPRKSSGHRLTQLTQISGNHEISPEN